jgi:hypothetical protein
MISSSRSSLTPGIIQTSALKSVHKVSSSSYSTKFREFVKNASDKNQQKKRCYIESFGIRNYDKERYGQEIDADFFATKTGHAVIA